MVTHALRSFARALEVDVGALERPLDDRLFGDEQSVLMMAGVYVLSLYMLKAEVVGVKFGEKLKVASSINSLIMCLYSLYAFAGMALHLAANWADDGFSVWKAVCDPEKRINRGLDFWMYHFYLSKFWEWIDTWILILKGKSVWPPENSQSLLHVCHHCVTASVFWVAWRQELPMGYLGPITNAFVHIPVYGYYFITEHRQGARWLGVYITPIQIVQFLVVMAAMVPSTLDPSGCGAAPRAIVWWWFAYSVWLVLFTKMFFEKMTDRWPLVEPKRCSQALQDVVKPPVPKPVDTVLRDRTLLMSKRIRLTSSTPKATADSDVTSSSRLKARAGSTIAQRCPQNIRSLADAPEEVRLPPSRVKQQVAPRGVNVSPSSELRKARVPAGVPTPPSRDSPRHSVASDSPSLPYQPNYCCEGFF